jgi:hypothetical protein
MARPPHSAIVDPKTGQVTPEWLDFLSRDISDAGSGGGVTIIKSGSGPSGGGGGGGSLFLDAANLTGTTIASNVIYSSLTSVGVLTAGSLGPGFIIDLNSVTTLGSIPWTALPAGSGVWSAGHVEVTGTVKAQQFVGDGSGLTNLPPAVLAAHALTHETGGSDAIANLSAAVLTTGLLPDARLSINVLKVAGGYTGDTTAYLRADGTFAVPAGGGGGTGGTDEVFIGPSDPGAAYELWYDTDDPITVTTVTGPAAATDNALARFDTTTGKLIQDSSAVLSDAGNLTIAGKVAATGVSSPYYDLLEGVPANPAADIDRLYAVDFQGFTFLEVRDSGGTTLRLSRDFVAVGKVAETGGITKGQVVYVSGGVGSNRLIKLARADSHTTLPDVGVALEAGANNAFIRVLTAGLLNGVNTNAWAEGTQLYVSPTTAGALTPTQPQAPNLIQPICTVLRQHATLGDLGIYIGWPISEAGWSSVHASMHETGGRDPLTALSAAILTTGTLADARLSANVALQGQANTFTQNQFINRDTPVLVLTDTAQPVDARAFYLYNAGQQWVVSSRTDAGAVVASPLALTRLGDAKVGRDLYEKNRSVPMGHWTTNPFNAGSFGADAGGNWAVEAGDYFLYRYMLIGKTLFVDFQFNTTTLYVAAIRLFTFLPSGFTFASTADATFNYHTAGTGGGTGLIEMSAGATTFAFLRDIAGTAWPVQTNTLYVRGQFAAEIQ